MSRPRLAAIISAIVASVTAFFVITRWGLAGTLAGAAVFAIVYNLVSHWSNEGLDRLGHWLRRRRGRTVGAVPARESPPASVGNPTIYATRGTSGRHRRLLWQWALVGVTVLTFAFSVYSFVSARVVEKVVVREQVIEKTVVVPGSENNTTPPTSTATPPPSDTTTTTVSPPPSETSTTTPPATSSPSTSLPAGPEPSEPSSGDSAAPGIP